MLSIMNINELSLIKFLSEKFFSENLTIPSRE